MKVLNVVVKSSVISPVPQFTLKTELWSPESSYFIHTKDRIESWLPNFYGLNKLRKSQSL